MTTPRVTVPVDMNCPKCGARSGDDWEQCGGRCPMPGSPHYSAAPAPEGGAVDWDANDQELIERGLRTIRTHDAVRYLREALTATTVRLTGYDWNADPDGVTKQQGDAFAAADRVFADLDAAVASHPEIELPECQTCGGTGKIEEAARMEGANKHSACIRTCDDCDGCGFAPDDEPAALATREERRECDDCGFKGTSDDASKEQDYCTACGGNSPAGGPDECAHCGAKNHMVMACPKCGGRFSLDEDDREEAPAEAGEEWSRDDIETLISDALIDSFDVDWDTGDGAMAVRRALEKEGLLLRAQPPAHEDARACYDCATDRPHRTSEACTHPASDALRVAVEASSSPLEIAVAALRRINDPSKTTTAISARVTATEALSALQTEQGAK